VCQRDYGRRCRNTCQHAVNYLAASALPGRITVTAALARPMLDFDLEAVLLAQPGPRPAESAYDDDHQVRRGLASELENCYPRLRTSPPAQFWPIAGGGLNEPLVAP
jgi:hypothetical protein